jgi:hypothetical protein
MLIGALHYAVYLPFNDRNKFHFLKAQHNFLNTHLLCRNSTIHQGTQNLLSAARIRSFLRLGLGHA